MSDLQKMLQTVAEARIFDTDLSIQLSADLMDFFRPLLICDWKIIAHTNFKFRGIRFPPFYEFRSKHCDKFFRINVSVCMKKEIFASRVTLIEQHASEEDTHHISKEFETEIEDPKATEKLCQISLDFIATVSLTHRIPGPFKGKNYENCPSSFVNQSHVCVFDSNGQ